MFHLTAKLAWLFLICELIQIRQGSGCVMAMCYDVPHKMSVSNLMHDINRRSWEAGRGICETCVQESRFKILFFSLGEELGCFTWVGFINCPTTQQQRLHRGEEAASRPSWPCHSRWSKWMLSDLSGRLSSILYLFILQWQSLACCFFWSCWHVGK